MGWFNPEITHWLCGNRLRGKVAVDYGYNDNVSYQPHSSDAIGSSFQSAAPVLSMIGERGQDKYLLMYSGDYRNYSSDSADNYNDHFSVLTVLAVRAQAWSNPQSGGYAWAWIPWSRYYWGFSPGPIRAVWDYISTDDEFYQQWIALQLRRTWWAWESGTGVVV